MTFHLLEEISVSIGRNAMLFYDGSEMLQSLKSQEETPQIIFLDVEMTKKHGLDILSEIRSITDFNEVPVVMLSSNCDDKCTARCFEWGANYFIPKAYSYSGLKKSIENALNVVWEEFRASEADFLYQH